MDTVEKVELSTDFLTDCTGKVTEASVKEAWSRFQSEAYRGKHVVVKGCAPTWAVMQLQHRLEGVAAGLSFALFDGREFPIW